ncbi:hypothetical protein FJMB80055_21630 [Enterobacter hormaechei]|nr:hypothetical protein OIPHN069_19490 [Enterobacter hormaechei subsp. hoffmannii]BDI92795.1 hypothetical protein FJMB80004_20070 [Enterobacter hormaechei]BDI97651.1 hypothetical protein FJMB80005_20010 [Enterobacter hormaechei]BDJ02569.1 hypothetical protein FJMB80007_19460 [Enterobacter hormaechei]BDJ07571.1 hypothetical protein FJMB80008_20360 [Enterobacter hormaechei]
MNGMTTTAVCSPHPNPLPGGARGLLSARINLWGTLSPLGEGWSKGNSTVGCYFTQIKHPAGFTLGSRYAAAVNDHHIG